MRCSLLYLALMLTTFHLSAQTTSRQVSEYLMMKGSIGKSPVVFHLYRVNNDLTGYYYYEQYQQPVSLRGKIEGKQIQLHHDDYQEEQRSEHFTATLDNSTLTGNWRAGSRTLPLRVRTWNDSSLNFQYIYVSGKKKIPKTPFTSIDEASYQSASIWPTEKSFHPAVSFIKSAIRAEFGKDSSTEDVGKIMLAQKNQTLNFFSEDSDVINYAIENRVQVIFRDSGLLSLASFNYAYTGGAHGNYGTTYTTIDLQRRKKFELSDVIDTFAAKAALKTLLEKAYRTQYEIPADQPLTETLFVESIEPNNNFFLTEKCIAFNYTPYEIGAYALGEVLLYVPLKYLKDYLKPGIFTGKRDYRIEENPVQASASLLN